MTGICAALKTGHDVCLGCKQVDDLAFALPQTYEFSVMAQSTFDSRIQNWDTAQVTFTGFEAVEVGWLPAEQVAIDALSAPFMLLITNTGNVDTLYILATNEPIASGCLTRSWPTRAGSPDRCRGCHCIYEQKVRGTKIAALPGGR